MNNIKDETIELITSEVFNESFWLFELGRAEIITANKTDIDNQFMNSFYDNGQRLWQESKDKIVEALCDRNKNEPREMIQELTSGNIKDIVVNIISLLTTTYSFTLAIAIPLCALILKKGINNICKA